MTLTLKEVNDTCIDWELFCDLHGFNYWAINEGYGDTEVTLTIHQAHHLGIVKIRDGWKVIEWDEVYPPKKKEEQE